jgi:hypothetical protein
MDRVSKEIYRAVIDGDDRGLPAAREQVRRSAHRDLLVRRAPGLLRLIDALDRTGRTCDVRAADPYQRGVCHLRRGQLDQALLAFARVERRRGGATARDVAVRLLAERRRQERALSGGRP